MVMDYIIEDLMEEVVERKGSDLHISAGLPPYIRINGHLTRTDRDPLTPEECQRLIFAMWSGASYWSNGFREDHFLGGNDSND